ncbi:MAG: alpha-2-macroglobulin, partial [Armatimonadota bacterium]
MRPGHGFAAWHLPVAITILCAAPAAAYLIAGQAPTGVIQGQVLAEDTGAPLPNAHVHLEPLFPMRDRISGTLALRSREDGAFGPHRLIAGRYRLSAYTKAHTLADTLITIPEAETRSLSLELARDPSRLQVYVHEHVWTPDEPVTALCEGLLDDDELSVSVYAADLVRLLRTAGGSLYRWVARADERFPEGIAASPDFTLIASISVPITGRDIEGSFQQHVRIPLPKPGLYVLAIRGDGIERKNWVLVTDLGLITKQYGDTVLAYAADLASGSPVARASVTVYRGDAVVARGATGPDGIARLRLPSSRHSASMLIFARRRQSLAAVQTWYSPASAREFVVYTYTDRPVYRPGHLVHFKGIARRVRGHSYEVPDGEALLVEVRDDRDTLLYREQLRTNDYGAFSGALKLPPTAGPGRYELQATIRGKRHISGFFVAEYRKPQYRVAVRSNRPRYVRGDTALVTVAAEYYFGEPVAGAAVGYSVRRTSYWFPVDPETAWEYYDYEGEGYGGYGEIVESGHTETGDDGKATIRISTGRSDDEESDHDWRYAVEVNVTGPGRQTVTSSGGFIVTRGEFVLHLTARRWGSRPGQSIPIDLRAVDYDRKPQPNVPVAVTLQRRTWRDDEVHFTQEERQQVRTDADGKAAFTVTPRQEGSYVLKAVARDARGNTIVGREYLWVTSSRYADFAYDYPDLEIITDKPVYEVGDQIAALINTKAHGATALVTVEGEGLRDWFLTKLEGKSTRLTLPVRPEYIPNVYLTVSLVRNKDFVWRQKPLRVSQRSRTLTLSLEPNKPEYAPGEPATYDITTLDPQGRPVPAEISLGVVDDSIYAVREESVPDIVDAFYARRPNLVSTDYSFPRIYLGNADKAGGRPRVRKRFPDTAFWRPVIRTNAEGKARVSFKMPDTLTTWRATARAITLDTLAGSAVNKVVCRKDFMVRLNTPRFLVQGDRATITGIAHNRTPRPLQVRASLDAGGLEVLRAPALAFTIPPAGTHRFEWTIRPFAVGRPRLTLSAHAPSRLRDALAKSLPVIPRGRERVEWRAGAVASATRERLVVRRDAVPGTPRGLLLLSPSITSSIWDALEYLAQYPWGCTEQTMSSFLPDVLIAQALDDLGISRPRLAESLPDMVQAGLIKLYGYQR